MNFILSPRKFKLLVGFCLALVVVLFLILGQRQARAQDEPSDKMFAMISDNNGTQIWLVDSTGHARYALPNPAQYITEISWSGSGRYIAATSVDDNGESQILIYDLADLSNIPAPFVYGSHVALYEPVWFKDTLAFVRNTGISSIWLVKPGGVPEIVSNSYASILDMQWSPDGKEIAFSCSQKQWDDNSDVPPQDVHICKIHLGVVTIENVTLPAQPAERYPFWLNGQLTWVSADDSGSQWISNARGKLFGDPYMTQIGTPVVNGSDVYISAEEYQQKTKMNMWRTLKFTCNENDCEKQPFSGLNKRQPSISSAGLFVFQTFRLNAMGQIMIWDPKTNMAVTMPSVGNAAYWQPVWRP